MSASRQFLAVLASVILGGASTATVAESVGDCPLTDQEFVSQLSAMNDWKTIYAVFKRNLPACPDDGMFAEGYSDVVVRAFAKRWSQVRELQALTTRDPVFRTFVLRHIDATADPKELNQTLRNAKARCPAGANLLCKEIVANATAAIKEMQ